MDPVSEGKAKCIAIDEQPKHQVVPLFRLGEAQGAADKPLDPDPQMNVFTLDLLRVLLPRINGMMLLVNSGPFVSERNGVYSATKNCAEELL